MEIETVCLSGNVTPKQTYIPNNGSPIDPNWKPMGQIHWVESSKENNCPGR